MIQARTDIIVLLLSYKRVNDPYQMLSYAPTLQTRQPLQLTSNPRYLMQQVLRMVFTSQKCLTHATLIAPRSPRPWFIHNGVSNISHMHIQRTFLVSLGSSDLYVRSFLPSTCSTIMSTALACLFHSLWHILSSFWNSSSLGFL